MIADTGMVHRLFRLTATFVLAACAVTVGGYFYFMGFSPDRYRYPVRGIDVSNHQGAIDWRRVAADDVAFAIIKATEGGDFVDRSFARNLAGARSAGIAVGAYHFFTLCRPGADQAQNFIATVPRDGPLLPPVIDIEFGGNCPDRPSIEKFDAELKAFLEPVETAFGKKAIVYIIGDALEAYGGAVSGRRRWVRSLAMHPGHDDWIYWQYHNSGTVDGIEGPVDLNVLQGELAALAAPAAAVNQSRNVRMAGVSTRERSRTSQ
jgi:lysozyme